jgi:hypothetical protein
MTAARQERKSPRRLVILAAALGMLGASAGRDLSPASLTAAATERVVSNRHTGLAIDGFDPVAYFVDAAPLVGRAGLELSHAGAIWRFRNEGNRAAFAAHPATYMPRLGGHDPIAVARGVAAPGHPRLWSMVHRRLYLFHSEAARTSFMNNPERAVEAAERNWPRLMQTLIP